MDLKENTNTQTNKKGLKSTPN